MFRKEPPQILSMKFQGQDMIIRAHLSVAAQFQPGHLIQDNLSAPDTWLEKLSIRTGDILHTRRALALVAVAASVGL